MKRILRLILVIALTVFLLGLFLWKSDLHRVWTIMKTASPIWLAVAFLTNLLALVLRTLRWQILLDADDPPAFYPTFSANTIGYMLSTVLPVRAGDVARPALLARRTRLRFSDALGTVLTERVLDLNAILIIFLIFAARRWQQFSSDPETIPFFFVIRTGAIGAAAILLALTIFVIGLFFFRGFVRRLHELLGRLIPKRFREPWMQFFDAFVKSLYLIKRPMVLVRVLFYTIRIWTCLTTQLLFALYALHQRMPLDSTFFLNGITTVSMAIPTPGGIGGFHKACQFVLTRFYKFNIDFSVAAALIFHLIGTLPVIITGLILFLREGVTVGQLRQETVDGET